MKRLLTLTLLIVAMQTSAQLMPLTNTRYGARHGFVNLLRPSDHDLFLFWSTDDSIRATKLADGYDRVGQGLLAHEPGESFDAAWTGGGFLLLSNRRSIQPSFHYDIIGRRLDANGQPAGAPFLAMSNASVTAMASSPDAVLLIYATNGDRMVALTHSGQVMGPSTALPDIIGSPAVASNGNGFAVAVPVTNGLRLYLLSSTGQLLSERFVAMEEGYRTVALAAHGSQYLIATTVSDIHAMTLDEQGVVGPDLVVDGPDVTSFRTLSATWNGNGWTVGYRERTDLGQFATFAHLTANADRVVQKEGTLGNEPRLALFDGHVRAAWAQDAWTTLAALPLSPSTSRAATFGAVDQMLVATATSQKGTLVVWQEQDAWRAGLRTHEGDWSEHPLGQILGQDPILASDGRNFVLVTGHSNVGRVYFLDEDGRMTGEPATFGDLLGSRDLAITWDGTHYAIAGGDEVRLLSPSGEFSAPVPLHFNEAGPHAIASNGHGYLVALESQACPFILCYSTGLRVVRFGPALEPLDATNVVLADEPVDVAGIVWNGTQYVAAFQNESASFLTSVPASEGAPVRRTIDIPVGDKGSVVATSTSGTVAILKNGVVHFANNGGTIVRRDLMDRTPASPFVSVVPLLTAAPGGRAFYLVSRPQIDAPIHGAKHIMFGIAGDTGVVPAGPHASIALSNTRVEVRWVPPAGVVNGYRVEYRVDAGNWLEVERYYGPGELSASIARPAVGSEISVRVRAFNDAGASSYSNVATTTKPRRRSTR